MVDEGATAEYGPTTTAARPEMASREFVDRSWLRWWPAAAIAGVVGLWLFVGSRQWFSAGYMLCGSILALLLLAFVAVMMERSVRSVTVDGRGVHARNHTGPMIHLPWEGIANVNGGGRYGSPLTLSDVSGETRITLHRRLSAWPELYALVRQARPEFWTQLDPSLLTLGSTPWVVVLALLQLPYALMSVTGERPFVRIAGIVIVVLVLLGFVAFLFDPRAIVLSVEGVRVKYPLRSRFVSRSTITGFSFVEHPFWRRGVKLHQTSGRPVHLGIMVCGEEYMLAVLDDWLAGGLDL